MQRMDGSVRAIRQPCQYGGTCVDDDEAKSFSCLCTPGWGGHDCDVDILSCDSNPCANGSVCQENVKTGGFVCACSSGWAGTACEKDVNECKQKPCKNSGTCSESSMDPSVALGGYACVCSSVAWSGVNCEADVNECAEGLAACDPQRPCTSSIGGYACGECSAGWASGKPTKLPTLYAV